MIHYPFAADKAELCRRMESRKLVAGGRMVWPVKRPDMRHWRCIADRMAEDLERPASHTRESAAISLLALGWTQAQIARHAGPLLDVRFGPVPARA